MLDRLRTVLAPSLEKLGIVFAKTAYLPTWTAIGLILSLAAAVSCQPHAAWVYQA